MMRGVVSVVTAVALAVATPVAADTVQTRLNDLLAGFAETYSFPGATAAIATPDGIVVTAAVGLADREAGEPMLPETSLLAASIGKSFVAMTALALESEGLLARSDLVSAYLGGHEWFNRVPNHATMRVGDLMRHGAGLTDHVHLEAFQAEMARRMGSGAAAFTPEEAIAFVLDTEPLFPAGTGWAYSDTGYLLLGLVIEEVSGRSFYDLATERFLDPLDLEGTAPCRPARPRGRLRGRG